MRTVPLKSISYLLLTLLLPLLSCGNDAATNHEKALPHNLEQSGNISQQDAERLAAAKGKTAKPVSIEELLKMAETDTNALLVINFWKMDCPTCLDLQQHLQKIQQQAGDDKLSILAVNLDEEAAIEKVNLHIRQGGITAPTLLLKKDGLDWKVFSENWDGGLPALFFRTGDGFRQFYQQGFSENELTALLQPLLL